MKIVSEQAHHWPASQSKMSRIQSLGQRIADRFSPQRIILFGSHAYGTPDDDSDVDLLVIMPFRGQGFRKALEILNDTDPDFPVDLLVRTPEDAEKRYREGDPLIRMALDHGKVLYEKHRQKNQ